MSSLTPVLSVGDLTHAPDVGQVLDCAHIAVYNWDDDFSKEQSGQAAVRQILQEW